ncbi:unnamed protein product [Ilex paraguariensis]|uniref:Uncharacterized protein n=1 Tax=Ilex paraguariensis TaxID=185542 RepID=A0ABC8R8Z0_9AQUA
METRYCEDTWIPTMPEFSIATPKREGCNIDLVSHVINNRTREWRLDTVKTHGFPQCLNFQLQHQNERAAILIWRRQENMGSKSEIKLPGQIKLLFGKEGKRKRATKKEGISSHPHSKTMADDMEIGYNPKGEAFLVENVLQCFSNASPSCKIANPSRNL